MLNEREKLDIQRSDVEPQMTLEQPNELLNNTIPAPAIMEGTEETGSAPQKKAELEIDPMDIPNEIRETKSNPKARKIEQKDKVVTQHKKKAKKKRKESKGVPPVLAALLLIVVTAAAVVQGMDRITAAQQLIGSTQLPTNGGTSITDKDLAGDAEGEGGNTGATYKYIDTKMLDEMTAVELALWFYESFGSGTVINETEKTEFESWYKNRIQNDRTFALEFQSAMTILKENPDLLTPSEPVEDPNTTEPNEEPEDETEPPASNENENTEDPNPQEEPEQTPPSEPEQEPTTSPQPNPEPEPEKEPEQEPTTDPQPDQEPESELPTEPEQEKEPEVDLYPHLDEEALEKMTTKEVATWAAANLPYSGPSFERNEFFGWLNSKGAKFANEVKVHLIMMGWGI